MCGLKIRHIKNVNLLSESRFLKSKFLIYESNNETANVLVSVTQESLESNTNEKQIFDSRIRISGITSNGIVYDQSKYQTSDTDPVKFENVPFGEYLAVAKNIDYIEAKENFTLNNSEDKKIDFKLKISKTQELSIVDVKTMRKTYTSINFNILDTKNRPIPGVTIKSIKNSKNEDIVLSGSVITDVNGSIKDLLLLNLVKDDSKEKIYVNISYPEFKISKTYEYSINKHTGIISSKTNTFTLDKDKQDQINNIEIKIDLTIPYTIIVKDINNEYVSSNINIYNNKKDERPIMTYVGKSKIDGIIDLSLNKEKNLINNYELYVEVSNSEYNSVYKTIKIKKNDINQFEFIITPIKPPKPPKPPKEMSLAKCRRITLKATKYMSDVDKNKITINDLGGDDVIKDLIDDVKNCYIKYNSKYGNIMKKNIFRLDSTEPHLNVFNLNLTHDERKQLSNASRLSFRNEDINVNYIKKDNLYINSIIKKVIYEHSEVKNLKNKEFKIINDRFNFIVENFNSKKLKQKSYNYLLKEKNNLINTGYDKNLINKSFLNIIDTFYGY